MKSVFENRDYDTVKIMIQSTATENITLRRGKSDNINGPEGETFRYAWKTVDVLITDTELRQFGAMANYGDHIRFGTPKGKVP